jgi:DNA-binding MarR family transcriptional regulator
VTRRRRPLPLDPIVEARRHWIDRWGEGEHMAAATSVIRAHQILMAEIDEVLRPFALTFASYEALMLLVFSRRGELPLGRMSERLMVHPASVTNTVDRLEERGLVRRRPDPADGRRVLAELTPEGRRIALAASEPLNRVRFGLAALDGDGAATLNGVLRRVRAAGGDLAPDVSDPWSAQP